MSAHHSTNANHRFLAPYDSPMPTASRSSSSSTSRQASEREPRWARSAKLHVRAASRPGIVFVVPMVNVQHAPRAFNDGARLMLCRHYDVALPSSAQCPAGSACVFVHADIRGAIEHTPHERNPTWRSLADVPYPRYPAGVPIPLAKPNRMTATEVADSGCLLRTRALEAPPTTAEPGHSSVVSHCAHFLLKGMCHRGPKCQFAHLLRLPGSAAPSQPSLPVLLPSVCAVPLVPHGSAGEEAHSIISPLHAQALQSALATRGRGMANTAKPKAFGPPPPTRSGGGWRCHNPYAAVPVQVSTEQQQRW